MPSAAAIAPPASATPTILAPSCCIRRAAQAPTFPKPCITNVAPEGSRSISGAASRNTWTTPRPVAASRPKEPSSAIGLPVTQAGVWPWSFPYSSMSQAMTWALVPTSGAGMSRWGPSTFSILSMKERATAWSSFDSSLLGSTFTPPFAPPYGMFTIAVFQVMSSASARTSSRSTSGWKRMPPL